MSMVAATPLIFCPDLEEYQPQTAAEIKAQADFRDHLKARLHERKYGHKAKAFRKTCTRLRKLTHNLINGERYEVGEKPRYRRYKERVIAAFNERRFGYSHLTNKDYADHFSGKRTLYFVGGSGPKTLFLIEVDVLKALNKGSVEGGRQFMASTATLLKDLPHEPSTNGKGQHSYPVLVKEGKPDTECNELLLELETWLRWQAYAVRADIENVEVKGLIPILEWKKGHDARLRNIHYPTGLAKFPRNPDLVTQAPEFTFSELAALVAEVPQWFKDRLKTEGWEQIFHGQAGVVTPAAAGPTATETPAPAAPSAPQTSKPKRSCASVPGRHITPQMLDKLPELQRLACDMMYLRHIENDTRYKLKPEYVSAFFLLLWWFGKNPEKNGAMPKNRWMNLWRALAAEEVFPAWNGQLYTRIRDWLTAQCRIQWIDSRYQPGFEVDGKFVPGVAAKWQPEPAFLTILDQIMSQDETGKPRMGLMDTADYFDTTHIITPPILLTHSVEAETGEIIRPRLWWGHMWFPEAFDPGQTGSEMPLAA